MTQSTGVLLDSANARAIVTPSYNGADTTPAVIVERTEDAGQTWMPVRGDLGDSLVSMLGGTSRQIVDYEIPFDTLVQYRTIKAALDGTPNGVTFNLSASVRLVSTSDCLWWVHPVNEPNLIGGFVPQSEGPATLGASRGITYGEGATYPLAQLGVRQARSNAKLTFVARTNAEKADLLAALGAPSVLCVRGPAIHDWARRFVIVSTITEQHLTPFQAQAWIVSAPYWEVERTTEAVESFGATYDQLAAGFATYAALRAGFGTFDDQTIGLA